MTTGFGGGEGIGGSSRSETEGGGPGGWWEPKKYQQYLASKKKKEDQGDHGFDGKASTLLNYGNQTGFGGISDIVQSQIALNRARLGSLGSLQPTLATTTRHALFGL